MLKTLENTTRQLTLARSLIKSNQIIPFINPKFVFLTVGSSALKPCYVGMIKTNNYNYLLKFLLRFEDYELASRISETMQIKIFQDIQKSD